jgi:hypothetical protein
VQRLNLLPDGAHHRLTVAVDIGEHHDPRSELFALETFPHNVERRLLLADYEQRFSAADRVRDHIDDGLAFPGSRRPLDNDPGG